MTVLAIIPARGGSKGIPRKNIKKLGGQPLVNYTIKAALNCDRVDRVIVSTEDEEIAEVAKGCGAEVPFLRPKALADDEVPVLPVVQHLVKGLQEKENYHPDIVVVLQPTNPFRGTEDIRRAIDKLVETGADCVVSLSEVDRHPFRMRQLLDDKPVPLFDLPDEEIYAQRQELPKVYYLNGAVIACKRETMMQQSLFYGPSLRAIVVDQLSGFDIDSMLDWQLAETFLSEGMVLVE